MNEYNFVLQAEDEEKIKARFSKRLKEVITKKQLRKSKIYNSGVVSRSTLDNYTSNNPEEWVLPSTRTLIPLSRILEVPLDYLLGEDMYTSTEIHSNPTIKELFFNLFEIIQELDFEFTTTEDGKTIIETSDKYIAEFLTASRNKSIEQIESLLNYYKDFTITARRIWADSDFECHPNDRRAAELKAWYATYGITSQDKLEYPDECLADIEARKEQWDKATPEERKQLLCELTDK